MGCCDQNGKGTHPVAGAGVPPYSNLDRKAFLHPVADCPAHDATAMQVESNGKVKPAHQRPDIGDIARPFTVERIGGRITVQPVRCDTPGDGGYPS